MNRPIPHQIYRHFKGNLYQVSCIATHSETGEEMVVYQALYGDYRFYVRPLDMFMSKVDRNKYPDVTQEYRFEPLEGGQAGNNGATAGPGAGQTGEPGTGPLSVSRVGQTDTPEAKIPEETEEKYDESKMDPDVCRFWDAETFEQRVEILDSMKYKITNEMIDIMSIGLDIEIEENDNPLSRFEIFRAALMRRKAYEGSRLR